MITHFENEPGLGGITECTHRHGVVMLGSITCQACQHNKMYDSKKQIIDCDLGKTTKEEV